MLLRKKEEIEAWLNQYNVKNYELIEDDTYGYVVNVNDNVNLSSKKLKNIEVKFNKVKNFFCDDNELESLQGCPEIVEKNFTCSNNKLITLEDCPKTIERDFYCDRNKITSLKGCPKIVKGYFNCEKNYLKSLKDGPEIVGKYNFTEKYIDSLDGLFDIKNGKMVSRYPEIETEKYRYVDKDIFNDMKEKGYFLLLYTDNFDTFKKNVEVGINKGKEFRKNLISANVNELLTDKQEIKAWLDQYEIKNYTINLVKDEFKYSYVVDVKGDVKLSEKNLKNISVQFGEVSGNFDCSNNELVSLKGSPRIVNGSFFCNKNQLDSLEYSPIQVKNIFDCSYNKLVSLKGCTKKVNEFWCDKNELKSLKDGPKEVLNIFSCSFNNLTSLEGAVEITQVFQCSNNKLTSLENGPQFVNEMLDCSNNNLVNLKSLPTINMSLDCSNNQLKTLDGSPEEIRGSFYCDNNQLNSLEGGPKEVEGFFDCSNNELNSLKGAPEIVRTLMKASDNPLLSLEGCTYLLKDSIEMCSYNRLLINNQMYVSITVKKIREEKKENFFLEILDSLSLKDRIDRITNINLSCTNDFDIFKNKVLGKANDLKIFIDLQRNKLLSEKNTNKPKF